MWIFGMHGTSDSLPVLAAQIKAEHQAVLDAHQRALEHALTCGDMLIEAKAKVRGAGERWLPWLENNCAIPARTATHYMHLARHRGELEAKSATVADLSVRAAMELIAPEEPDEDDGDDASPADADESESDEWMTPPDILAAVR